MTLQNLSNKELDYYSRQIVLKDFGLLGQRKLKESRVCVVGAGGLGSPIMIQLASMGAGYIRVIDRDVVDISNLQRQHIYSMDVLGVPKVEAAKKRLTLLNPFIQIEAVPMSIKSGNAEKLLDNVDLVVDALDAMNPRYAINRACNNLNIPFIHGGVIMQHGIASTIIPGKTACLECFQGNISDKDLPGCAVLGVHPSVISIIASIQVSEAVKILLGNEPELTNKLLFVDIQDLSFEKIQISKLNKCPVCGKGEKKKLSSTTWEEICGREGGRTFVYSPEESQNVDLEKVKNKINKMGYKLQVSADMGVTFMKEKIKGSILFSGVSIFEGFVKLENAKSLRKILID
jgi:adenylyltransferase/sulfurtransferase